MAKNAKVPKVGIHDVFTINDLSYRLIVLDDTIRYIVDKPIYRLSGHTASMMAPNAKQTYANCRLVVIISI